MKNSGMRATLWLVMLASATMTLSPVREAIAAGGGGRVLLISFDGFRYDYLDRASASLPNMREIAESTGVRSELLNAFVTKTFPNHYTLATGLYEESHGMYVYSNISRSSFVGHSL